MRNPTTANSPIPDPYTTESSLAGKSPLFKGRQDIFRILERELGSQTEPRPVLLLFGGPRMGKTSLLCQLPTALSPQIIPVVINLPDSAYSGDTTSILGKIAAQIRASAFAARKVRLPPLTARELHKEPYRSFAHWMEKSEKKIGARRLLLCLDGYEHLEKMLDDGRIDERFLHLLSTFIQNRPRLALLLSGAHTLDDLRPFWSDYLDDVRVIKLTPLQKADAEELIARPSPDFPLTYEAEALRLMLSETGCHPCLIQAACQNLIRSLNEERRFTASPKDVEQALQGTLTTIESYFTEQWNNYDSTEAQRIILLAIAHTASGSILTSKLIFTLENRGFTALQIHESLLTLYQRDILAQKEGTISFCYALVRRWVRVKQLGFQR
jgi:uncharacterized protein